MDYTVIVRKTNHLHFKYIITYWRLWLLSLEAKVQAQGHFGNCLQDLCSSPSFQGSPASKNMHMTLADVVDTFGEREVWHKRYKG